LIDMDTTTAPAFAVQRAGDRAVFDFGWLKTHHSFSFADYYDPENLNWGALRVFNDDTVAPGKGFGTHPHRDMEIVTYVLRGELEHRDSLGHHGVVPPGGVQYMSAGTGVTHSEFNHSAERDVHFVQMWVLPKTYGIPPSYGQREFATAERAGKWLAIASGEPAVEAPIRLGQDATVRVAQLTTGGSLDVRLSAGRYGFLFVATGTASANGERLAAGDALRLRGPQAFAVSGDAELVFWDVPPTNVRLDDA
jgi:redox-sensitive bicupin YhaK (pirin superfamily)